MRNQLRVSFLRNLSSHQRAQQTSNKQEQAASEGKQQTEQQTSETDKLLTLELCVEGPINL